MNSTTQRRSSRLFKKFVEDNATKIIVDNMVDFIKQKLDEIQAAPRCKPSAFGISLVKEQIAINIYATIVYHEWNSPATNDQIFAKPKFADTLISKLRELIDYHGKTWSSVWANSMLGECLKIKDKRFENCCPFCGTTIEPHTTSWGHIEIPVSHARICPKLNVMNTHNQ